VPTWGELGNELVEIEAQLQAASEPGPGPYDVLRRKYLSRLSSSTGRATFLYYSGWQDTPGAPPDIVTVGLGDIEGFMEACSDAKVRELDLFIHSPGGDPDAAEQISEYLRTQFDHIRAIVPVVAMSAATMLALSADEVIMGAHSQLGPIDPQVTIPTAEGPRSASAQAVRDQFEMAKEQCQNPALMAAWLPILRMFGPGLLAACDHAARRAKQIVETAMRNHMLAEVEDGPKKAAEAAEWFGDAATFLSHGRPVRRDEAREHHVAVLDLEDDPELQDLVLSVHHSTLHTIGGLPVGKLIENDCGRSWIRMIRSVQMPGPVLLQRQPEEEAGPKQKRPPDPPNKKRRKRR
jgi:hypothetical protein